MFRLRLALPAIGHCTTRAALVGVALVALASPRPLIAQGPYGPQVTVAPTSQTFSGSTSTYTVAVSVQFCDNNNALDYSTLSLTLDGGDVSSDFSIGGGWVGGLDPV